MPDNLAPIFMMVPFMIKNYILKNGSVKKKAKCLKMFFSIFRWKYSVLYYRRTISSETIFGNWKSFKNDEKHFLFNVKSSFCSQDI